MQIHGYKIERQIGKGGMATVYLAIQESLARAVVLKVLSTQLGEGPEFAKRFLNEGHLLASINHPNVITIFDIGIADNFLFISMEYVGGGDLSTRIAQGMEPADALEILDTIAAALGVAHKKGIIHRDVKPANILYREDGTPVLTDFGIAKHVGDNELTSTGTILGSPYYMSPEQVEGRVELDGRSDIYSLGIIFYEMLTGKRPFTGDSAINIVLQHLQSPIPILPKDLVVYQPLLNLMLAKNREDRVLNAATLREYVEAAKHPENPENTRKLQQHAIQKAATYRPRSYHSGEINQKLEETRKRSHFHVWILFGNALLFVITTLGWYFASEISRYGQAAVVPSQRPSATSSPSIRAEPAAPRNQIRVEVVTALKWLARKSLEDGRLTYPPEDNAYYYFSRLLEIDPGNTQAVEGIAEVANRYAALAKSEVQHQNYPQAEAYIAQGLSVDPENKRLQVLHSKIQLRERSFVDSILDVFRS